MFQELSPRGWQNLYHNAVDFEGQRIALLFPLLAELHKRIDILETLAVRIHLEPQFLQRLSPYRKPVIPFPVRDAQRLLLLVYPPTRRFFHRNIRWGELPGSNGVPEHFTRVLFEHDQIQEIEVQ